jgi:hypothetical protein
MSISKKEELQRLLKELESKQEIDLKKQNNEQY